MELIYMVHGSERPPTNGDPMDFPLFKLIDEYGDKISAFVLLVPAEGMNESIGRNIHSYINECRKKGLHGLDSNVKT